MKLSVGNPIMFGSTGRPRRAFESCCRWASLWQRRAMAQYMKLYRSGTMRCCAYGVLFITSLLLIAGCASKPTDQPEIVQTSIYEGIPEHRTDPVVCKRVTGGGTRISSRVCLPASVVGGLDARVS